LMGAGFGFGLVEGRLKAPPMTMPPPTLCAAILASPRVMTAKGRLRWGKHSWTLCVGRVIVVSGGGAVGGDGAGETGGCDGEADGGWIHAVGQGGGDEHSSNGMHDVPSQMGLLPGHSHVGTQAAPTSPQIG